jgi:nanoRNase/pAp phosphatase (c-di-AMP/oligoRNAs hydrolase)
MTSSKKYRLITRSDFDGVASAALLKELDLIDEILFVHPKDMQDGKIEVTERDITTNLPYAPTAYLAFDHHASETLRIYDTPPNHIIEANAPSATRVVYNYFGGKMKFPNISQEMLAAVDKSDSAQFTLDDILYPKGWVLLSFLMDSRTGLGRFKNFRISNYELMLQLVDVCAKKPVEEILEMPDVKERVELYFAQEELFKNQLQRCGKVQDHLVTVDLRQEEVIYAGNRFMVYALFPNCNISMHIMWGLNKQNTVFAVGKSILNRTNYTNIGELMLRFGGGGHVGAGTCQVPNDQAQQVQEQLTKILTAQD